MNRKFLLLISFFIAIVTTTISFVIAPQEIKSQTDFVLSDLGVYASTALIFNTGLIIAALVSFQSINFKNKKNLLLLLFPIGVVLIALFNKEDYSLIHWIGASILFLGLPFYFFVFYAKTQLLKIISVLNGLIILFAWISMPSLKFEAQVISLLLIFFYIINITFSKNENNRS